MQHRFQVRRFTNVTVDLSGMAASSNFANSNPITPRAGTPEIRETKRRAKRA